MSTTIKLRRSSVPGNVPTTAQLDFGELAINTADGKVFFKSGNTTFGEIQELSPHAEDLLNLIKTVDGANSGLDADLLDGQEGSYYLDYNNFVNVPPATLDLTLSGKVTGTAFSNTGVMTLVTELANTGVTPGTYGSSNQIPILTIDEDGRITSASNSAVAGVDDFTWDSANNQLQLVTGDGTTYNIYLNEFKDLTVEDLSANTINITSFTFDALDVGGDISANNVIVDGLVDGRDIAADGLVLDGLAASTTTVNLSGDVTGSATSNSNGEINVTADIANSGVAAGTYGSATAIPVLTIDLDGRVSLANTTPVAGVDDFTYSAANNTITLQTGDGSVFHVATETEVTLTGDVTGTATATNGDLSIATDIANSGVTPGSYGSSSQIPIVTVGLDGRITSMSNTAVAGVEDVSWTPANSTLTIETGDGSAYNTVITDFHILTVNGNTVFHTGNDGPGSGLDADTLDGYSAQGILDASANNASNLIGDGTITISGNTGLTGAISFTLNQANSASVVIEHADTSSQASVDNANGSVIQDVTLDNFGHVTGLVSVDLDGRYVPNTRRVIAGTGLSGGGFLSSDVTLGHADTSSVADVNNADGNVLQDITFDTFGHVQTVSSVDLDTRYLTQADADTRYVNVTGDTMTGDLVVQANIDQDQSRLVSSEVTASSVFPFIGFQFSGITYGSAELTITAKDGSNRHITKLLITHNNTTAIATEYGSVYTSSELASYDVGISSGNVNVTFASVSGSTNFKIAGVLLKS